MEKNQKMKRKVWCVAVKDMVEMKTETSIVKDGRSVQSYTLKNLTIQGCTRESTCLMKGTVFCQIGKTLTGRW